MESKHTLKLISLNIELDRHLDRALPFLLKEDPDVVCLQEVWEKDMPTFKAGLRMEGYFAASCVLDVERVDDGTLVMNDALAENGPEGIALLSKLRTLSPHIDYYEGNPKEIPRWSLGQNRILLSATVEKEGTEYTIGTTHFTWTPDGKSSEGQKRDMTQLLGVLARFPDIVFCGDFNAPRGGEIWGELAKSYKDNIPATYRSSIDPALHRVRNLEQMVDGLFSTPLYRVFDVRLVEGVSDHMAIVGSIERVAN